MANYFLSIERRNAIVPVFENVRNVNGLAFLQHATGDGRTPGFNRHFLFGVFTAVGR